MGILDKQIEFSKTILANYNKKNFDNTTYKIKASLYYLNFGLSILLPGLLAIFSDIIFKANSGSMSVTLLFSLLPATALFYYKKPIKYTFDESLYLTFKKMMNEFDLSFDHFNLNLVYKPFDDEHVIAHIDFYENCSGEVRAGFKRLDIFYLMENIRFVFNSKKELVSIYFRYPPTSTKLTNAQIACIVDMLFNGSNKFKQYHQSIDYLKIHANVLKEYIVNESTKYDISIEDIDTLSKEQLINVHQLMIYDKKLLQDYLKNKDQLITDKKEDTSINLTFNLRYLSEKYHESKLKINIED